MRQKIVGFLSYVIEQENQPEVAQRAALFAALVR
jgi:hypothetical protein